MGKCKSCDKKHEVDKRKVVKVKKRRNTYSQSDYEFVKEFNEQKETFLQRGSIKKLVKKLDQLNKK